MLDDSVYISGDGLLNRSADKNQLLKLCEEYFEISIGCRRPSKSERTQASEWSLKTMFSGEELTPVRRVKMMKYPYSFHMTKHIQTMYQIEYAIFQVLTKETSIVDGPYLPMFRYELLEQKLLSDQSDYDMGILRQSAFLETLFKMKMGVWKDSDGDFLNWHLCVDCAYRGEDLITESMKYRLEKLAPVRNSYAHDWKQYALRKKLDEVTIRDAFICGLGVIAELYSKELYQMYTDYSLRHSSKRLPTKWSDREKSTMTASGEGIVGIVCDRCSHEFKPRYKGWKRCPNCDACHDYLNMFETTDD
ncbi:hypothetical protein [Halococcus sp. IIIV-5B]|uniref:hypothetical protein n=1 Tax=Halococcus sp. IIIV-5B TaxID=2321230 RepID=UPI0011C39F1C|nr:hypothetical protein [Halococcus sp. IIIV-5B]